MARHKTRLADWRPILDVERGILKDLYNRLFELAPNHRGFIESLANNKSISRRQAWYLAWVADRYTGVYRDEESKWIRERLMEECPAPRAVQRVFMGSEPKTGYWEKPVEDSILHPRKRKFRN